MVPAAPYVRPMATQRRPITGDEYRRLWEIGVLGEKVELLDGWIVYGKYPFAFSDEAVAAARAAGIEFDEPTSGPGHGRASVGTPLAASDAEALALAALIARADTSTIARAEHDLARAGAERNDTRLLDAADRLRVLTQERGEKAPDEPERSGG